VDVVAGEQESLLVRDVGRGRRVDIVTQPGRAPRVVEPAIVAGVAVAVHV